MADIYEYIVSTGVIVPDTSSLYAAQVAEYQGVFGANLITTPDSPAGVFITAETLAEEGVVNNNAALANQINPNVSQGVFLDAIGGISGVQREAQVQTYVTAVTLTGVAGTVVPAASLAQTAAGDQFATVATVTIGAGGTVTVDFQSVAFGPIPCGSTDLDQVVSNVLGWETVSNSNAGVLGTATQSDLSFRAYRNNTLGFQGISEVVAQVSGLYAVPGVTSVFYQENTASTTQTINGVSMVGKSVYAVVNGGAELDIATSLLENKTGGSDWNGSTTVDVVEPASGQTYAISFDYATPISISFQVTSPNGNTLNIQNAILAWLAGTVPGFPLQSGTAWAVGGSISAFECAAAIVAQYPTYIINLVQISLTASISWQTTPIQLTVQQIGTTSLGDISVLT